MSDFAQGADTGVIRGQHFDAFVSAMERNQRAFVDSVDANKPLFVSERRSDIDRVVEQLPSPERIAEVLTLLAELPNGDENQLREVAGLFDRIEAENTRAAGGWIDAGRNTTAH